MPASIFSWRRPNIAGFVTMLLACVTVSCTIEPASELVPSPIIVERMSPEPGARGVARNQEISFWFSAPIDPGSIGSRAIDVTSAGVRQGGTIHYDPIERRLTYSPNGRYRVNLTYDAVLSEELRGLRRGEPVEAEPLTFETSDETETITEAFAPDYVREIEPILGENCGFSGCHASPNPSESLDLSSVRGLRATGLGSESSGWASWAIIDPGSAAWSYIIYKLIGEQSVRGDTMPPWGSLPNTDIETIAEWIDDGAKVDAEGDAP